MDNLESLHPHDDLRLDAISMSIISCENKKETVASTMEGKKQNKTKQNIVHTKIITAEGPARLFEGVCDYSK